MSGGGSVRRAIFSAGSGGGMAPPLPEPPAHLAPLLIHYGYWTVGTGVLADARPPAGRRHPGRLPQASVQRLGLTG